MAWTWQLTRTVHLIAAAIWLGGLIALAALVPVLRRAEVTREQLIAAARAFGRLSWIAMSLAVVTGIGQVQQRGVSWSYRPLHHKLLWVGLACACALGHQLTARRSRTRVRAAVQAAILLCSVGIYWAATRLHLS